MSQPIKAQREYVGPTNGPDHGAVAKGHAGACIGLEVFLNLHFANDAVFLADILKPLVLLLRDSGQRRTPVWDGDELG